ncbi:hypothetical protein ACFVS2_25680 [Brevibacillus sp. NPDC058079]|uniref:hypothetical protein n=1 Tax=Brevibacillus sp. NPDC058079 TaxID=3346330 RepID=UPI0036E33707
MDNLFTAGITVFYGYAGTNKGVERYGWAATLDWQGKETFDSTMLQGTIETRYFTDTLEEAIDSIFKLTQKWSIKPFPMMNMFLFYKGDGNDSDFPPPKNYREMLRIEAEKRGWDTYKEDSSNKKLN